MALRRVSRIRAVRVVLYVAVVFLAMQLHPLLPGSRAQNVPAGRSFATIADDAYFTVSDAFSPPVSYGFTQDKSRLLLSIRVGAFQPDGRGTNLSVGLSAGKTLVLHGADGEVRYRPSEADYVFSIRKDALWVSTDNKEQLRFAFAVSWSGGFSGGPRLQERFLQRTGALAGSLSSDPMDWLPINLAEQAELIAGRRRRIWIDLRQPMDGKATIVIEDQQGKRVRNLISGEPIAAGDHRIEWDGLDDLGNIAAPGSYHWKAVSHPGVSPQYLFSFYNHGNPPWRTASASSGWLADHSNAVAAATSGGRIYLGAPVAESGHNVIKVAADGTPTGHVDFPTLVGIGKLFLLADESGFYAVMEGTPQYGTFHDTAGHDTAGGEWEFRRPLNVLHWDLHEQPLRYDGARGERVVSENLYRGRGPHPRPAEIPAAGNLAGAAIAGHKIYISLRREDRIAVLESASGQQTGEIKVAAPGLLAADGNDSLIGFSGNELIRIDTKTLQVTRLFVPTLSALLKLGDPEESFYGFVGDNPTGMAVDGSHNIYLSDNGTDQNIKVFSNTGRLLREIGARSGRPLTGAWRNDAVYRPHGITIDEANQLWVTETDGYPRRISVWNIENGQYLRQYLGPARYGAPEASFDTEDHTRWIGSGVLWKLDFARKTAEPLSVLFRQSEPGQLDPQMMGLYWNFYHRDGRTFLISYGGGQSVYELQKDGRAKLWAICGTLSSIAQLPRWTLPKAIAELPEVRALFVANARQLGAIDTVTPYGPWGDKVKLDEKLLRDVSILWVDKNGDGVAEADEFEVLAAGDSFYTPVWGTGSPTLDMNIPAKIGGSYSLLHLKADGFLPSGAPNYSLKRAIQTAAPLDFHPMADGDGGQSIQDRLGREIFNTTPMRGVAANGTTLWTFPNRWVGVAGSHQAPLPRRGEVQGVLYFLGTAPLDGQGEVMILNGNYGRFFVMTTDGMYLDEFFKDGRISYSNDAYRIGGEPFGGFFGRGEDGRYYLQSGQTDYRIFEIEGLQQVKRSEGSITVSQEQALAAQSELEYRQVQTRQEKTALVPGIADEARIPANPERWPVGWNAVQWGDASQPFPFAQVKILRSNSTLHLAYRVKDPSPWKNNGGDWTLLFKTGDSVDFQFSTDPAGDLQRTRPALGDKRLLIAPFHAGNIAVLYSYREKDAKSPMPFTSPWRSEQVDRVEELKDARISVAVHGDSYYEVIAAIPLAELGLPAASGRARLRGDFGVIYGDAAGTMNQLRSYWSNQATGLVNDVPGEVTVEPKLWGTLDFEESQP